MGEGVSRPLSFRGFNKLFVFLGQLDFSSLIEIEINLALDEMPALLN